jgi:hypothetical protein
MQASARAGCIGKNKPCLFLFGDCGDSYALCKIHRLRQRREGNMGKRADAATSLVNLSNNQTLAVSLPRHTRLLVTAGAVRLTYAEPSLDWLGEAAPLRTFKLYEGDAHIIEQPQYVSMTGACATSSAVYVEVAATAPAIKRLFRWFARFAATGGEAATTATTPTTATAASGEKRHA